MTTDASLQLSSDAELVAAIACHDPLLAHRVQRHLRSLRLRLVLQSAEARPVIERHSVWQSLRWPWRQRG